MVGTWIADTHFRGVQARQEEVNEYVEYLTNEARLHLRSFSRSEEHRVSLLLPRTYRLSSLSVKAWVTECWTLILITDSRGGLSSQPLDLRTLQDIHVQMLT